MCLYCTLFANTRRESIRSRAMLMCVCAHFGVYPKLKLHHFDRRQVEFEQFNNFFELLLLFLFIAI